MSNEERQLLNDVMAMATNGSVHEKLAELMGMLRKNVDSDVQARLELLEKENAELRKDRDTAERNAKRVCLEELVAPFTVPAWTVGGQMGVHP